MELKQGDRERENVLFDDILLMKFTLGNSSAIEFCAGGMHFQERERERERERMKKERENEKSERKAWRERNSFLTFTLGSNVSLFPKLGNE